MGSHPPVTGARPGPRRAGSHLLTPADAGHWQHPITGIPQPGPQAAAAAVARAGRPPAGTVVSVTGRTAHDQIRDERGLDRRRAAWSDGRQVTGDGGQTAISGRPADTRPRRLVPPPVRRLNTRIGLAQAHG